MEEFKFCSVCGVLKPLSDYYTRRGTTLYYNYCKECQADKTKQHPPKHKTIEGNLGEQLVIAELLKHGIYATTGKCSEYKNQDVVAWGCVRIEVKTSKFHEEKGAFKFGLGEDPTKFDRTDIVVLVCLEEETTYHVFKASDSVFYHEGHLKKAIEYKPNAHHRKNKYSGQILNPLNMCDAKNNWSLTEEVRQAWTIRLNTEGKSQNKSVVQESVGA